VKPDYKKEKELWDHGYEFVCGIDEAGRGALAGPLVAGAVILKPGTKKLFDDSKVLSRKKREELFDIIKHQSICWSTGICSTEEINNHGIQSATYLGYKRAIDVLQKRPSFLIIDHYRMPAVDIPQSSITKGDSICQSIAAASIVAKVTRDRIMDELDKRFPIYGLSSHAGYGTKYHLDIISKKGISSVHRLCFTSKPKSNQLNFINEERK